MKIIDLSPTHASTAARLHIAGQPGTFLTSLGAGVLTALYRALPQSTVGFGFAAHTADPFPPSPDSPPPTHHSPVGFVAATTSTGSLFRELGTRHLHRFLPPLLARLLQQPALLPKLLQTAVYPFLHGDSGDNCPTSSEKSGDNSGDNWDNYPQNRASRAELLSIMVEPRCRGQGIGTQLLQRLIEACETRGLTALDVTVDAQNSGARRFYERHGFAHQSTFQLYGRAMCSYRLYLLANHTPIHPTATVDVAPNQTLS